MISEKKYAPEFDMTASKTVPGQFYQYVSPWLLEQMKKFIVEAEEQLKTNPPRGEYGPSAGPLVFTILSEEDQAHYVDKRKRKKAPDAVFKLLLSREEKVDDPGKF